LKGIKIAAKVVGKNALNGRFGYKCYNRLKDKLTKKLMKKLNLKESSQFMI
jgi:hypothetical protein